jgi:hypothetical protein
MASAVVKKLTQYKDQIRILFGAVEEEYKSPMEFLLI